MSPRPQPWRPLRVGDFVRLAYRLGRARASGVCHVEPNLGSKDSLVLHQGALLSGASDAPPGLRLAALSSSAGRYQFVGETTDALPTQRATCLASFARRHLETQLDSNYAARLVGELAGIRLSVRRELTPPARILDVVDRRILAAMSPPRRLDQIWPLARTPRYRLLAFLHFLRGVDALEREGVAARQPASSTPARNAAERLLGVRPGDDFAAVKQAYRRLVRATHPDLHPSASPSHRRHLEQKLAEINHAYEVLS